MASNLENYNLFTVLVAGDVDLTKYSLTKCVEPYPVYKYAERKTIRQTAINAYNTLLEHFKPLDNYSDTLMTSLIKIKLDEIKEMTDEEYYAYATQNMTYDDTTGDALSTINPNGKYRELLEPTLKTALPLHNNQFICKRKDLQLNVDTSDLTTEYSQHWDYVMEKGVTSTKEEYRRLYKDKQTYLNVMTEPFFYNAFVSNETGWVEQCDTNQIEWVLNFKEKFIKPLNPDIKLQVYNFKRF